MSKMTNHTGRIVGTMIYSRTATWDEICRFKPNITKNVTLSSGVRRIRVGKSRCHYWWGKCVSCKENRLVRADRIQKYRCKCNRIGTHKTCPGCHKPYPRTAAYWYFTKKGCISGMCKTCSKSCAAERYKQKRLVKSIHYDRDMIGG